MYAAILLATEGAVSTWALEWLGFYLVTKVVVGILAGIVVGRLLAYVAFRSSNRSLRVGRARRIALGAAALIASYGVGELWADTGSCPSSCAP